MSAPDTGAWRPLWGLPIGPGAGAWGWINLALVIGAAFVIWKAVK